MGLFKGDMSTLLHSQFQHICGILLRFQNQFETEERELISQAVEEYLLREIASIPLHRKYTIIKNLLVKRLQSKEEFFSDMIQLSICEQVTSDLDKVISRVNQAVSNPPNEKVKVI